MSTALVLPSFTDLRSAILADLASSVTVLGPDGVTPVPLALAPGGVAVALADAMALVMDFWMGQLEILHNKLLLDTAAGDDLDRLLLPTGVTRLGGLQATVPVKATRTGTSGDLVLPSGPAGQGLQVLALDGAGGLTLSYSAIQDPARAAGIAGLIPDGQTSGWFLAQADAVGARYNVGAGAVQLLATPLADLASVANPAVVAPAAPSVVQTNLGVVTTPYLYRLLALGLTGASAPSPSSVSVNNAATLDGAHYNTATWADVADEAGFVVQRWNSSLSTWQALASVATGVLTYTDNGTATPVATVTSAQGTSNAAVGGTDAESDPALRARAPYARASAGGGTSLAILAAVTAIAGVARAFVLDAGDLDAGVAVPAGEAHVKVLGSAPPISVAIGAQISAAIAVKKAAGDKVPWAEITPTPVAVSYTATAQSGTTAAALAVPIATALAATFATFALSGPASVSAVLAAIQNVAGVSAVQSVTMIPSGGSSWVLADVPASPGVLYSLGALTATLS